MSEILFASIFWYFLNIKNNQNKYFFEFFQNGSLIKFFVLLIFIQITLGAFTSGLDAGQIYQTWPSMNNNFFPDDIKDWFKYLFEKYEIKNIFLVYYVIKFIF